MRNALGLLGLMLFGLLAAHSGPAGEPPSARGGAIIRINGTVRNFAFNAHRDPDGRVRGQGELHNRDTDARLHLEIDCLSVEGNVATMSGVHRHSTREDLDGRPFWFRVVDNGEAAGDPPDEITLVVTFLGPGVPCDQDYPTDLIPIEGGNVQVRP